MAVSRTVVKLIARFCDVTGGAVLVADLAAAGGTYAELWEAFTGGSGLVA